MADNDNGNSFALGLLVGGILGTVVGLLIAPKSGTELRTDLTERSEAWRTRAEELAATVRERVGPAVETARDRIGPAVETVRDRVGPTVEEVRERVAPAIDSVRERVTPVVEQVRARTGRAATVDDGPISDEAKESDTEGQPA